jgi:eukaryotic-like serine/threonine-protein kinase
MSEESDLTAVEEFGPYLVYERLGVGGMATVHRALERGIEGFERVVALKRLLPHLAEDASFIRSFVREAKLASTLQHPNIVQTLELGRVGATYFISMEYIDGRDVRKILRHARKVSGPPPINVTLALMLQLCDALDYAHNRTDTDGQPLGLVHRDLSPSNLLITRGGHLKVIDFGIAKAQSAQLRTQTGRVKGKLAYMPPESIAGKELDARSDLFAAGVVFHELLTARPLFAQKNEYQTLLKVQRGEVAPPSTFNEGVPKELDDIVLRTLAATPDGRWESAAALRDALVSVRMARQLSATPRDVQTWCDWAFSLDISGFTGKTFTEGLGFGGRDSPVARTPYPRASSQQPVADEEAAAEIAWGAPEHESGKPHILEDVPDVSGKTISPVAAVAAADVSMHEATDQFARFDGAALEGATATQPELHAATIRTHAAPPPPGSGPIAIPRGDLRPAAFPAGSSNDALLKARPTKAKTITIPPLPEGSRPPASGSRPPPNLPRPGTGSSPPPTRPATARPDQTGPVPVVREPSGAIPTQSGPIPRPTTGPIPTQSGPIPRPTTGPIPTQSGPIPRRPSAPGIPSGSIPAPQPRAPTPLPSTARGSTTNLLDDLDGDLGADVRAAAAAEAPILPRRAQTASAPVPTIGAAIATRKTHGARNAIIALLVLGGAAVGITLYVTGGSDVAAVKPATSEPIPTRTGTVKFVIEPADATVKLGTAEPHVGSPWATQLPAGTHQVEIRRDGYKSWLTTIELSAGETQTMRVVLEQVVGGAATETATLIVEPSLDGMEVVLDGVVLEQKTPVRLEVKPGPHTVALRQDGDEVWREEFTAAPNQVQHFDPSMSEEKKAERVYRHRDKDERERDEAIAAVDDDRSRMSTLSIPPKSTTPTAPPHAGTAPGNATTPGAATATAPTTPATTPGATGPAAITTAPPKVETPVAPAKIEPPKTPQITTPKPSQVAPQKRAPVVVPPSAVSRTSGSMPSLRTRDDKDLPAQISAKVCIDTGGGVASATILSKIPDDLKGKLTEAIRGWRYTPYKDGGVAVPACFVASFRSK